MRTYSDTAKPEMETLMKNCGWEAEDVQPRLTIHKQAGKKVSQETRDYNTLFGHDSNEPSAKRRYIQQRKILLKGPLGSGKSTIARKVQKDWVKDTVATFSFVFFILAKLVNPGDPIESVIVQQYSLEEEDKQKILNLVANHNRKCCIIFDGIETMNVFNKCVLHVMQDKRFSQCDVIITSDILETVDIDKYFDTVCETQILTEEDAKGLVFDIVKDEDKVKQVMNSKITGPSVHLSRQNNPMFLSFLACLVANNEMDRNEGTVTLGTLYVQFVKFVSEKHSCQFDQLRKMGKLSLDVLLGKRFLRETDDDVKELGSSVFDSGLLVRHSNGFVTCCHKSLDIFLAAVFLVVSLSEGGFGLCPDSLLLNGHLLLYFCLSLVENPFDLCISNIGRARESFEAVLRDKIDRAQLDLTDFTQMYPVFAIEWKNQKDDHLVKNFVFNVLSSCKNIVTLTLSPSFPFVKLFSQMNPGLSTIQKVQVGNLVEPAEVGVPLETRENEIDILVNDVPESSIEELLKTLSKSDKRLCIYVICSKGTMLDLTILFQPKVKRIHVHQMGSEKMDLLLRREIPKCPVELLHLSSLYLNVGKEVFSALSMAVREGKLACLTHLCLVKLHQAKGMLMHLFESEWPNLTHLDMSDTGVVRRDVECLQKYIFPRLTYLSIHESPLLLMRDPHEVNPPIFYRDSLMNLKTFRLRHSAEGPFSQALIERKFPNITELELLLDTFRNEKLFVSEQVPNLKQLKLSPVLRKSMNFKSITEKMNLRQLIKIDLTCVVIWGELSLLVRLELPCLESLVLSDCSLMPGDLRLLSDANRRGHLAKLRNLDLSKNSCLLDVWDEVFAADYPWKTLTKLNVSTLGSSSSSYNKTDLRILGNVDCFPKLRELGFSVQNRDFPQEDLKIVWEQLDTLEVYSDLSLDQSLKPIVQALEKRLFPALRIVRVLDPPATRSSRVLCHELRSKGITLQFVTIDRRY